MNKHFVVDIVSFQVSSHREPEEYGSWSSEYQNKFNSVSLSDKSSYRSTSAFKDAKIGDVVFVVWAEYSTGDSFGHAASGSIDIIDVFSDVKLANALKNQLKTEGVIKDKYGREKRPDWQNSSIKYKNQDGIEITYNRSWLGYFESLDEIHISTALVGPDK